MPKKTVLKTETTSDDRSQRSVIVEYYRPARKMKWFTRNMKVRKRAVMDEFKVESDDEKTIPASPPRKPTNQGPTVQFNDLPFLKHTQQSTPKRPPERPKLQNDINPLRRLLERKCTLFKSY